MNDSLLKIIGVATGVCLVCSIFVSAAAVSLKPYQEANKLLFRQQNILAAAGLITADTKPSVAEAQRFFDDKKIEAIVVDLKTGTILEGVDPNSIDPGKQIKNPEESEKLGALDIAKIGPRPNKAVVYVTKKDGKIDRIVFPIYGKGLWSTMYGFISLNAEDLSVAKINFYDHAETAGLGGEISNPKWQANWEGKKVYEKPGNDPTIVVVRNGKVDKGTAQEIYQVDGIAGSTLTSNGVSNTVRFWLGQNGFQKVLDKILEQNNSSTP